MPPSDADSTGEQSPNHRDGSSVSAPGLFDRATGPVTVLVAAWVAALVVLGALAPQFLLLSAIGCVGAFIAGLVGIGGAIVVIPMLLYLPPLFGAPALAMHTVAGVEIVRVTAASLTGMLAHRRLGRVDVRLVPTLGLSLMLASLTGGLLSRWVPSDLLQGIFASLALVATILMVAGPRGRIGEGEGCPADFNRPLAVAIGLVIGLLGGLVGAGGGFLLVPAMVYVLGIPVRTSVGTALGIVALGAAAGSVGKALTGQVDWLLACVLITGSLPGAQLGAACSKRIPAAMLARLLAGIIGLTAGKMWWDIFRG